MHKNVSFSFITNVIFKVRHLHIALKLKSI